MTERNDYIPVTRKKCISNDNEGRMIERNFVEIQGTFLVKIRDNTFNGEIGENVFKHINKFLEVVGPIKLNGVSQDRFRLSIFPISLADAAGEWFKKDCIGSVTTWEDLVEKFVQKFYQLSDHDEELEAKEDDDPGIGTYEEYELNNHVTRDLEEPCSDNRVPYQLCDHICEPYHFKNEITYWPTCSLDIDGFCNGGELLGMVRVKNMTYFQDHKWYDELADGILKEETLMHKAKVKESWGNVTPDVMKFFAWLINSFRNFHELDYNVLVKLKECWWKINAHEVAPFTRLENYGHTPYANIKTEKAHDPYLEIDNIFGRNYYTSNDGNTQDNQGHE
ncbi:hypothetical protein Tco_0305354 [Tanacetum coccineum]